MSDFAQDNRITENTAFNPDEAELAATDSESFSVETETNGITADNTADVSSQKTEELPTGKEAKTLAIKYFIFAAIALASVYIVQIFHVFDSLFDKIYYGNLTTIFYYVCNIIFWIPFIIVFNKQVKRHTGFKLFRKNSTELSLKRSLIIYACAIVPIFIVSAALGFELKVVFELGKRVTGMQLYSNASMYIHGGVKLLIAVMIIELVQEACNLLYRGKYCDYIPWGGIALALIYGFTEVIVAYATGGYTMFAWLYIAFDLLYGIIYLLSKKSFFVTYFVSLIIYIL